MRLREEFAVFSFLSFGLNRRIDGAMCSSVRVPLRALLHHSCGWRWRRPRNGIAPVPSIEGVHCLSGPLGGPQVLLRDRRNRSLVPRHLECSTRMRRLRSTAAGIQLLQSLTRVSHERVHVLLVITIAQKRCEHEGDEHVQYEQDLP